MGAIVIKANRQRANATPNSRAGALIRYVDDRAKCTAKKAENMLEEEGAAAARELAAACDAVDPGHDQKLIHHHVISFKPDENEKITDDQLYEVAREYMKQMGMQKCPQHMAIHRNTAHPHLHLVFAQVDAETGKKVKMPLYHVAGQKTIAIMAQKYGWELHARSRYAVQDNKLTALTPPPREIPEEIKATLAAFCDANRDKFASWKWANLHQNLAELGIGMEYRQGDGLSVSADGAKWYKTAHFAPEMTYKHLANKLNAKSYRKARPEVLARLEEVRKANQPAPSRPAPQSAAQEEKRQDAAQPQGAPIKKEEIAARPRQQMRGNGIARTIVAQTRAEQEMIDDIDAWEKLLDQIAQDLAADSKRTTKKMWEDIRMIAALVPKAKKAQGNPGKTEEKKEYVAPQNMKEWKEKIREYSLRNLYAKESGHDPFRAQRRDARICYAHIRDISGIAKTPEDADKMIALRLAVTGHDASDAEKIMMYGGIHPDAAKKAIREMYSEKKKETVAKLMQKHKAEWVQKEKDEVSGKTQERIKAELQEKQQMQQAMQQPKQQAAAAAPRPKM